MKYIKTKLLGYNLLNMSFGKFIVIKNSFLYQKLNKKLNLGKFLL